MEPSVSNDAAEARAETGAAAEPRRANLLLLIFCSAQLVLAVDVTVVNVANASIERALGFTAGNLQWTVTAYSLTFGGFLLLGGRMADLFGRRRLFVVSVAGFAITSICAGSSQNTTELIASRAAQGFCAAVISPVVLSLLAVTFPDGRPRQRAYGLWATAGSVGGLVGFLFGGLITSFLGWRWIFFVNGPIAALAIAGALFVLPRLETRGVRRRLDVPGAITVTLGLALVIYGLGEAQSTSWTSRPTLVALSLAPIVLGCFFLIERRTREPLLPLALLRRRAAGRQPARGLPAVDRRVHRLPRAAVHAAGVGLLGTSRRRVDACTSGWLRHRREGDSKSIGRYGGRRLVLIGFAFVSIGCALLARAPLHQSYFVSFLPALLLRSFGQGLLIIPIVMSVTSGIPQEDQGIAAGLYNMSQQLGGALGLAAVATVAAAVASGAGGGLVGEAHGVRFGFLVVLGLAVVAALVSAIWLRTPNQEVAVFEVDASPPGAGDTGETLPQGETSPSLVKD